jgi:hypothetical protein
MEPVLQREGGSRDIYIPEWLPYVIFIGVSLLLSIPLLRHMSYWGIRDWDLFTTLNAATVRSIVDYGQFPFWNPYIGGGNILFAHPEVSVLNPLFGLLLVFGPLTGLKIQIVVIYFLGLVGFYRLARQLGISPAAAFFPPAVFMLSSYFALHFAAGHIPFHYFAALPWLVLFYKKSLDKPVHILSAGGVVAFVILGSGAAVPLLFSLFTLFLLSLFDIDRNRTYRPPLYAILAGLCGVAFAAVKFLPMADYLIRNPWVPTELSQNTPVHILPYMFFSFNQSIFSTHIRGDAWGWHEYGAFVGPVTAALALVAAVARFKNVWPYLVLTVLSVLLVLGSFIPMISPWDLLHQLPVFSSLRVPSRLAIIALFCLGILAGKGVDTLLSLVKTRKAFLVGALFIAVAGINLFISMSILGQAFTRPPESPAFNPDFRQTEGDPNKLYSAFLANRGTIRAAWLSAYRPGRGILGGGNVNQEWYSEGNAVQVTKRTFTPNRISFDLTAPAGGGLVVSQGYDPGWHRRDGGEIRPSYDLISFTVAPGEQRIELYYRPAYFELGIFVSLLSIGAALAVPFYRRLHRSKTIS